MRCIQRVFKGPTGHLLSLFLRLAVVGCMAHDQEERYGAGEEGEHRADELAETVEGDAAIPQRRFLDCYHVSLASLFSDPMSERRTVRILQGGIAHRPGPHSGWSVMLVSEVGVGGGRIFSVYLIDRRG